MPLICYIEKRFRQATLDIIAQANEIIEEYQEQGFNLTLRQLYYQYVARDLLKNTSKNYSRLGKIVNEARLAGMIDWDAIVDRTRRVEKPSTWGGVPSILSICAKTFQLDLWGGQEYRPEVWIEKEALKGVIEGVCKQLRVPYFACKGYNSQSSMWESARRLQRYRRNGQTPLILHFGDHDSSGIDMTRDIFDRMEVFDSSLEVRRMALNMEQVEEYGPPPNPAKSSDPRFHNYMLKFGAESWELDALEPSVINKLIEDAIDELRDDKKWDVLKDRESQCRRKLKIAADNWVDVEEYIEEKFQEEMDELLDGEFDEDDE